jgi:hypothetical protein
MGNCIPGPCGYLFHAKTAKQQSAMPCVIAAKRDVQHLENLESLRESFAWKKIPCEDLFHAKTAKQQRAMPCVIAAKRDVQHLENLESLRESFAWKKIPCEDFFHAKRAKQQRVMPASKQQRVVSCVLKTSRLCVKSFA